MIFKFIKVFMVFIYFLVSSKVYAEKNKWESYIIHQNKKRDFRIYVPGRYNKNYKIPLVIVLHGGSGSGISIEKYSGFSKLAEDEKFIAAYPDAYSGQWNDGREFIQSKSYRLKIDDVGFISKMIDKIKKNYNIDEKRIYVAGISNGGFMALRLGCELSEKISGIAVICATMSEFLSSNCRPKEKISVLIMNGTDDKLVPYDGGYVTIGKLKRGKIRSTDFTLKYWCKINECEKEPSLTKIIDNDKNDGTKIEKIVYRGKYGADVFLYKIIGGGHTLPGANQYLPKEIIGRVSKEIDATKEIWKFFLNHPKVNNSPAVILF